MNKSKINASSRRGGGSLLVGPAFFAMAIWFIWGPNLAGIPVTKPAVVPPGVLSTGPRRTPLLDPPATIIGGVKLLCTDCHALFKSNPKPPGELLQHSNIVLNHGINNECLNCHDEKDRSKLVLYGGEPIPFTEVVRLCAKCHGPIYEDWRRGIHGRINGYWDTALGKARKLGCTECHNPHNPRHPAMEPLVPLPAPDTLRMGDQSETYESAADEADPLRHALHLADEAARRSYEEGASERQEGKHE